MSSVLNPFENQFESSQRLQMKKLPRFVEDLWQSFKSYLAFHFPRHPHSTVHQLRCPEFISLGQTWALWSSPSFKIDEAMYVPIGPWPWCPLWSHHSPLKRNLGHLKYSFIHLSCQDLICCPSVSPWCQPQLSENCLKQAWAHWSSPR